MERQNVSRRGLLLGAAGTLAAGGAGYAVAASQSTNTSDAGVVPFYGANQAGIATTAQNRLAYGTLNVVDGTSAADLRDLLNQWSGAAARMTRGELVGQDTRADTPPVDTGEAVGSLPANLTVTIGYGPDLFDDRFGLAPRRPRALTQLPALPNEDLDPSYTGGDIAIQACSDDPLVAFHTVRNLARIGMGVVEHNWLELGFGRTATTSATQATPRNLMGFKDGTRNILGSQTTLMNDHVWIGAETDQPWLRGGSYQIVRRIRMFIENWDRDYLADQQNVFGRQKTSGAPLTGSQETDTPDFTARSADGSYVIPADAHIRLAAHETNDGLRILRRGYSYTDGIDPVSGTLAGGLFFIAYMKNPAQFITLQTGLGASDALNEYITHTGSALFACPPGLTVSQRWGDQLFG
jgi:deferrochelatase/peroxidase EfeB